MAADGNGWPEAQPSSVLHCRNLPPDCTDLELISALSPLGRVSHLMMLKGRTQAFIQFASPEAAAHVLECLQDTPLIIRKQSVYFQFSMHKQINHGAPVGGAGSILHVQVSNQIYPVAMDVLVQVFGKFGSILKIITFVKSDHYQALIQFVYSSAAAAAKLALDGQDLYPGSCTFHIQMSRLLQLNVKYNNEKSWDFTTFGERQPYVDDTPAHAGSPLLTTPQTHNPMHYQQGTYSGRPTPTVLPPISLPTYLPRPQEQPKPRAHNGASHAAADRGNRRAGASLMGSPPHTPGCVVIVNGLDPTYVTPEVLFTLLGVYGDVERVKIMYSKKDSALVQMRDPDQARLAINYLNGIRLFGKEIHVSHSRHQEIQAPRTTHDDGPNPLTKDYSNSPLHRFRIAGSKNFQNIAAPSQTLHVCNIPSDASQEYVRAEFANHGTVLAVKFFTTKNGNFECKMGLVKMGSIDEAVGALVGLHNTPMLDRRHIRISFAKSDL